MPRFLPAALLTLAATVASAGLAQAQSGAPNFPAPAPAAAPTSPPAVNARQSPAATARDERRQRMTPDEARRDQQLEVLEARAGGTGNTSLSRGASQARQYERRGGSFTVRKFKDKRPTAKKLKRGQTHSAGGIDPKGQRLIDKKRKRKFLPF